MAQSTDVEEGPDTCSVCHCDFSLDEEGGASGYIGIIPVFFCPTCHAGLYDMYTGWYGKNEEGELVLNED